MANKVLQLIEESGAKWVDFRFTDTKGKEQHVTYPADRIEEDTFEDGKMFDGSSIAGWKGIEASDMILRPDAETGFIDPFFAEPTVVVTCDVIEPSTGQGYDRDPRSIARRAEEYLKSTGTTASAVCTGIFSIHSSFILMTSSPTTSPAFTGAVTLFFCSSV